MTSVSIALSAAVTSVDEEAEVAHEVVVARVVLMSGAKELNQPTVVTVAVVAEVAASLAENKLHLKLMTSTISHHLELLPKTVLIN